MKNRLHRFLLTILLGCGTSAHAEQVIHVGAYDVHYVVLGTTFLSAEVARRYGIERAADLAFVNISVLRNGKSVATKIRGQARDLLEHAVELPFREIKEFASVYYIASLKFKDQEHWRFALQITPVGEADPLEVSFQQQLYVE